MPARSAPSMFGFNVHTATAQRFVRFGGGVERLTVVEWRTEPTVPTDTPLMEWTMEGVTSLEDVHAALYGLDGTFVYTVSDVGTFHVDPAAGRIDIPPGGHEVVREQRLWSVPAMLCFTQRGDIPMHAAAVEVDGKGVLFAAPGRHGKTTLALAFHRQGHRVLSEDQTCCRMHPSPSVLPGPALLRVRPDVYTESPAGTHPVLTKPNRVFLGLDAARRGSGAPVRLAAIVLLHGSAPTMRLERMSPIAALPDLWALSFRLHTHAGRAHAFRQLSTLAAQVPIWSCRRSDDLADLDEAVSRLVDLVVDA